MLGAIRKGAYRAILQHRDSRIVTIMKRAADFVDSAYRNEGNDFEINGEQRNLSRLAAFDFKIVLDVGANVGNWSRSAATAWKDCSVHAFEIAPNTAEKLRNNLVSANLKNVQIHDFGLSDRSGRMKMYYFPDHDDLTCSSPRHSGYQHIEFEAIISTIDVFCEKNNINYIDYLKIDVEGDEHKVLRGASNILSQNCVACIQFEYGAFSTETRFFIKDYYALLGDQYHIGKIYPHYVDFSDYSWKMEDFRFCNYLCVAKSRQDIKEALGRVHPSKR